MSYIRIGSLYKKSDRVSIMVRKFLDGGPIIECIDGRPPYLNKGFYYTLKRYDGSVMWIWSENRWFAFGNKGGIKYSSSISSRPQEWSSQSMDKDLLITLADYYTGKIKPHSYEVLDSNDMKCSCGSDICYIEQPEGLFLWCKSGHGGKYDLDMNPEGVSIVWFR